MSVKHKMDTDLHCTCGIIMTGFSGCVFYVCICVPVTCVSGLCLCVCNQCIHAWESLSRCVTVTFELLLITPVH